LPVINLFVTFIFFIEGATSPLGCWCETLMLAALLKCWFEHLTRMYYWEFNDPTLPQRTAITLFSAFKHITKKTSQSSQANAE